MVALRGIIRDSLVRVGAPAPEAAAVMGRLEDAAADSVEAGDAGWDSYRNSFTMLMSKGYVQTVDQLRDALLTTEWEIGLRPIALQLGVSRFEAQCAAAGTEIPYDVISALYEDPTDLSGIADDRVRMAARACIHAVEMEQRMVCFHDCTDEAQKLAVQFSEVSVCVWFFGRRRCRLTPLSPLPPLLIRRASSSQSCCPTPSSTAWWTPSRRWSPLPTP